MLWSPYEAFNKYLESELQSKQLCNEGRAQFVQDFPSTDQNLAFIIFDVCNNVLARVRRLEGFPTWYKERKVLVNTDCGNVVEAVMYVQEKHQFLRDDLLYFSVDGDFTSKEYVEVKF